MYLVDGLNNGEEDSLSFAQLDEYAPRLQQLLHIGSAIMNSCDILYNGKGGSKHFGWKEPQHQLWIMAKGEMTAPIKMSSRQQLSVLHCTMFFVDDGMHYGVKISSDLKNEEYKAQDESPLVIEAHELFRRYFGNDFRPAQPIERKLEKVILAEVLDIPNILLCSRTE